MAVKRATRAAPKAKVEKDDKKAWALAALKKAGYGDVAVYRVYPPYDSQYPIECCFVTTANLAKTAFLEPDSSVCAVLDGWGKKPGEGWGERM